MQTAERLPGEHAPAQIRVRGLTKTYQRGGEPVHALAGIDLEIASGTFVAVMGNPAAARPRCSTC